MGTQLDASAYLEDVAPMQPRRQRGSSHIRDRRTSAVRSSPVAASRPSPLPASHPRAFTSVGGGLTQYGDTTYDGDTTYAADTPYAAGSLLILSLALSLSLCHRFHPNPTPCRPGGAPMRTEGVLAVGLKTYDILL